MLATKNLKITQWLVASMFYGADLNNMGQFNT